MKKKALVKLNRNSGIELLRILAAMFVIVLHYCNPTMGGGLLGAIGCPMNYYFLLFCVSLCCCAVNIFIIISGYFLIENDKRTLGKPLSLLFQVVLFHIIYYFTRHIFIGEQFLFSLNALLFQFIPKNYFVTLYVALYVLSPIINSLFNKISKNSYKKVLIVFLIIFSLYPSCLDILREVIGDQLYGTSPIGNWGSQYGYTIVNFVMLYCIGGYLKRFGFPLFVEEKRFILLAMCPILIFLWNIVTSQYHNMEESSAFSYLSPLVILESVFFLCVFKRIDIKSSFINELAKAAFTCFLFHVMIQYLVNYTFNRLKINELH